jgi:S-formylglutathione hydrolase FrmB
MFVQNGPRAWVVAAMVSAAALAVVGPGLARRDPARPAVTSGAVAGLPPAATTTPPSSGPAPGTTATTAAAGTTTTVVKRPAAAARPRRPGPGTVQYFTMASGDADGRRREFWVYRPGLPESADLPVVYFLHGYPSDDRDVADSGLAPALEQLFAAGVPPFVVVAPNGESSTRPDTEWADSADGKVRLENWIVRWLVPAVEGTHRRDRAHRAVAGFSMGGFGAMNLGLRHPDLFGQIVSVAGYFRVDDPDGMGGGDPQWAAANSPDQHVASGAASRMLLITAAGERDPLIAGEAQRFRRLAEAAGQHPSVVTAPGDHSFELVVAQLPTVARFLAGGW